MRSLVRAVPAIHDSPCRSSAGGRKGRWAPRPVHRSRASRQGIVRSTKEAPNQRRKRKAKPEVILMSDLVAVFMFTSAFLSAVAVFFAMRASYWKKRYDTLLDDAFERGCRAVVIKDDPTK